MRATALRLLILALTLAFGRALAQESTAPWLWPEDQERILSYARLFQGTPYRFGAHSFDGEDCSSFIQKTFSVVGIDLPRSSREQARDERFEDVQTSELRAGDLVFFRNTWRKGVSHVALMLSSTVMIHASPKLRQITLDELTSAHPLRKRVHSVRRWKNVIRDEFVRPRFSWEKF